MSAARLLDALRSDFEGHEPLRQRLLNRVPKYGNDVEWVDQLGARWAEAFACKLRSYRNARGGPYHAGFYTVSAHVPMGKNVGATPDGRKSGTPLADGGLSPMQGRDARGPTAVLQSVSRIDAQWGSNGTLLNMKFLPEFFQRQADLEKFVALLRGLVRLKIHHAQFNVVPRRISSGPSRHPSSIATSPCGWPDTLPTSLNSQVICRTRSSAEQRKVPTDARSDLQHPEILGAPPAGLRTAVFLKGCELRCAWCQNPEGLSAAIRLWHFERRCVGCGDCIPSCPEKALAPGGPSKIVVDQTACTLCSRCIEVCPSGALAYDGHEVKAGEVIAEVEKDRVFYEVSGGGVTLTGGEPLRQAEFSAEILRGCPSTASPPRWKPHSQWMKAPWIWFGRGWICSWWI